MSEQRAQKPNIRLWSAEPEFFYLRESARRADYSFQVLVAADLQGVGDDPNPI